MKVFNLSCDLHHRFEGWFSSVDDYNSQIERKFLCCPICESTEISRMPSAPRLNLGHAVNPEIPAAKSEEVRAPEVLSAERQRALLMGMVRSMIANTEEVGTRFPDEARKIHYGEAPARAIRGVASPEEHAEMVEEGIDLIRLPVPFALKEPLQ